MDSIRSDSQENACIDAGDCGSNARLVPYDPQQGRSASRRGGKEPEIKSGWGGFRPRAGRPAKRLIEARPLGPRWYVAEIMQRDGDPIVHDLSLGESRNGYPQRQPFDAHLPTVPVERLIRGQKVTLHRPMFPGYLFVLFDRVADNWPTVKTVDGVRNIISTRSGVPVPLPPGFVEYLIETAHERLKLPKVRMPCFEVGQRLRVEEGPFRSFHATCITCDGMLTVAMVHIFGRDTRVEFQRRAFSAAPNT